MTIDSWEPDSARSNFNIDTEVLKSFIAISERQQLDDLTAHIENDLAATQRVLMKQNKERWFAVAEALSEQQIIHLIQFFTVAESQLEGWEAGAMSPVIWLVKVLRKRKTPPGKELLLWIRSNSDNRFLPNGAL